MSMNPPATPRACESCRILKVRCRPCPGTGDASRPCERCVASGKECIYSAPRRTRRKRTDVRVRELEQEMAALTGLLKAQQESAQTNRPSQSGSTVLQRLNDYIPSPSQHQSHAPSPYPVPPRLPHSGYNDPISLGLLTVQEATSLFHLYTEHLAPKRPLVVFPPTANPDNVRATQPTLYLAVLAAAAGTQNENLGMRLSEMIFVVYADKIMMQGEKSIELIKAILVTTNWYCPPNSYEKLKFYQFVHIAATMCVDLGLGQSLTHNSDDVTPDSVLDCCRTMLACYLCCSSISLNFHRQNMFPFTHRISDCLATLESSRERLPHNAAVAAWTKLQIIVDHDSVRVLGLRDSPAPVDLSKPEVQAGLQDCSNKLRMWKMGIPADIMSGPLLMQYYAITCLVNEAGLHLEYSPDDFKPPYVIFEPKRASLDNKNRPPITRNRLSCIINCISAAQRLCDTFISMSTEYIQCLPIAAYARLGYTLVVLTKVSVSTSSPNGALRGIMPSEMTRVDQYLDRVTSKLGLVASNGCRAAAMWLEVIESIADWFQQFRTSISDGVNDQIELGILEPLKRLNLNADTTHDNMGVSSGNSPQPRNSTGPSSQGAANEPQASQFEESNPTLTIMDPIGLSPNTLSFLGHDDLDEFVAIPAPLNDVDFGTSGYESRDWLA